MSNLLNQVRNYEDQAYGGLYTVGKEPAQGPTGAQVTSEFARGGLTHRDARDEFMREKAAFMAQSVVDGRPGQTPFGELHATDEDLKWLQRKRDTEAAANLDAWISHEFNSGDVARRKWLQEVYPEFFEVRERQILDRAKFATRVNLLLLRGPKNEKDLILLWGLQTGLIHLDADWNKIGPVEATKNGTEKTPSARFAAGLMDFRRYKSDEARGVNATASNNPFADPSVNKNTTQNPAPFTTGNAVPNSFTRYPTFLKSLGL